MSKLSTKEKEAISVFIDYINMDTPFLEMKREHYHNLPQHFAHLPESVFCKKVPKHLYHFGVEKGGSVYTESGVLSCTTTMGKNYIKANWRFDDGDFLFKIVPNSPVVDVRKLCKVVSKSSCLKEEHFDKIEYVEDRVGKEREYIMLLDGVYSEKLERWDVSSHSWIKL